MVSDNYQAKKVHFKNNSGKKRFSHHRKRNIWYFRRQKIREPDIILNDLCGKEDHAEKVLKVVQLNNSYYKNGMQREKK